MSKIKVLDFGAEWCGPCRAMIPVIESLQKDFECDENVDIEKIDVEEAVDLTVKYNIRNVPTLIFLKDNVEVFKLTGSQTKESIRCKILELAS